MSRLMEMCKWLWTALILLNPYSNVQHKIWTLTTNITRIFLSISRRWLNYKLACWTKLQYSQKRLFIKGELTCDSHGCSRLWESLRQCKGHRQDTGHTPHTGNSWDGSTDHMLSGPGRGKRRRERDRERGWGRKWGGRERGRERSTSIQLFSATIFHNDIINEGLTIQAHACNDQINDLIFNCLTHNYHASMH